MLFMLVAIVSLFAGCTHQYSDFFPYFDDGTPKPHVALLPITDTSSENLNLECTQDISSIIRQDLKKHGKIFLPPQSVVDEKLTLFNENDLVSSSDLKPYLYFKPANYVVFLELVECKEIPYKRGTIKPLYIANIRDDEAAVIAIKMRMKIVDIREKNPKIIRQEIISSNHMVTKGALDRSIKSFGTTAFLTSPLHIANERLASDLSEKIEHITSNQR